MARAKKINLNEWFTPNTYDTQYKTLPKTKGVYLLVLRQFLLNESGKMEVKQTVLYVGSSNNLSERINNHPVKKKILFDYESSEFADVACYFKPCNNIKDKERRLIKLTQARYNKQWR